MNVLTSIAAGLMGTNLMTAFIYGAAAVTGRRWHVIHILATMLSSRSPNGRLTRRRGPLLLGAAIHYLIGLLFSFVFEALRSARLLEASAMDVLLFGGAAALVGMLAWRLFFALHPAPPHVALTAYLLIIGAGHLIYSLGLMLVYRLT